jgi:hypothetical protein
MYLRHDNGLGAIGLGACAEQALRRPRPSGQAGLPADVGTPCPSGVASAIGRR